MTTFTELPLNPALLNAVSEMGYDTPTPIQSGAIPALLDGRDLLGIAQTGTGKTAAFALPLLNHIAAQNKRSVPGHPVALILAPTRELAGQIGDNIRAYAKQLKIFSTVVFGGVSIRGQIERLNRGVHVLVATPGRLCDLMNQGAVKLDGVEVFVLDEADRMLDMGFKRDLQRVTDKLPKRRQTALFSATMPESIAKLAEGLLDNPFKVEIVPESTTVERIDQQVLFVPKDKKRSLLIDLVSDKALSRILVFTRTKHGADRVAKYLTGAGVPADAIHGNKAQNARQRALNDLKTGRIRALVATDIAARGIDVDGVTHVINFELPADPESYVHRIGRTARAGASGIAISFCDAEEFGNLRDIEKAIRQPVPVNAEHPYHFEMQAARPSQEDRTGGRRRRRGRGNGGGGRGGQPRRAA